MPRNITGPGGTPFVIYEPHSPRLNGHASTSPSVEIQPATAFKPEPISWLWPGWLARGKLHLLAGAPGTGKTTIALALAAELSRGGTWPSGEEVGAADVLIWSGEDGIADTLLPRLLAAGGAPGRVHFVTGMTEGGKSRPFDPATDMARLVGYARRLKGLQLVILDPVVAAVTGDSHKNTETRRGLQPVVDLAAALDCAVIGITHLSKNTSGREPLDRVTGSVAFGAVARVVLATVKPADVEAPRRLVRAKSNLGPDTGGFEYQLFGAPVPGYEFHAQRVDWGAPLEGSARELMSIEQPDESGQALEDAEEFLQDILQSGPVSKREIDEAAKAHDHSARTVRRAKAALGIVAVKTSMQGGWSWKLPDPAKVATFGGEDVQQT
ncbi:MAG: AAA family ATPase [Hyphomicrobiaceae bacterium]